MEDLKREPQKQLFGKFHNRSKANIALFITKKKTIDEPSTVAMLGTCGIFPEMYNFGDLVMCVVVKHSELHRKCHVLC